MNAVPIVLAEGTFQFTAEVLYIFVTYGLVLLGITSIFVGLLCFGRIVCLSLIGRPIEAAREREEWRSIAPEMARLAVKGGPILGLVLGVPISVGLVISDVSGLAWLLQVFVMVICASTLSGAIAAVAFWTSAALMRQARKKLKRFRGAGLWDRELDGAS